jgi:hypothetical protein
LKIGIITDWVANANCWKQDGPSLLASTVWELISAAGGVHRRLPVGGCA